VHNIIKIRDKQLQTTYYGYAAAGFILHPALKQCEKTAYFLLDLRESALQPSFSHENQSIHHLHFLV